MTDSLVEWKGFCEQTGKIPNSSSLNHGTKVTDKAPALLYEAPLGP